MGQGAGDLDDRPGDVRLPPGGDAGRRTVTLTVIGVVRSANRRDETAPKNPTEARSRGEPADLLVDEPYRPGLVGLEDYSHLIVLAWLDAARRDLIQITRPSSPKPRGVFALRSPVRPNPIALSVARILAVDAVAGRVRIDAIDLIDGTPILDIKPYRPGIDAIPDAVVP
jgi:tRNA-Thr(GGU) m(6)t(6)A37 methyltransferase TsaA